MIYKHKNNAILGKEDRCHGVNTCISISKSDITNWLLHTFEPRLNLGHYQQSALDNY